MGLYSERILPRLQDKVMDTKHTRAVRQRVCAGLSGEVVEIGFGTGLNVAHYPESVTRVLAVEPSMLCLRLAKSRIAHSPVEIEAAGLTGERLDLGPESADAVLSTWTFCTIPDLPAALAEIRRVLKPGGTLHFVEHGRAPTAKVARWQDRLEPLQLRVAGGCHLTRQIPDAINDAGLSIEELDTFYIAGEPKPYSYTFEGRAVRR